MEQSIHFGADGHANSRLATRVLRVGKRLVGRASAWRLERARVWAQGKIAGLSARRSHPATFPVACAVGMGLLWAQMHGYLHVPVSVCDWVRLGK
ncbi:hypothetical protein [Chitiniphilus shinanonensis]|uniref:hypothetical protein n=1 Tax=Chitiniphilus shinanonensis TaxID=553088 RepID=UPI003059D97B